MTHDSKSVIAAKRAERHLRRVERTERWVSKTKLRERFIENAFIADEGRLRGIVLGALRERGNLARTQLYAAIYAACGFGPKLKNCRIKRRLRHSIDLLLQKLYLEGAILLDFVKVHGDWQKDVQPHKRDLDKFPRTVSMIYLRPTNDIRVNRIAASVIGPVWGKLGIALTSRRGEGWTRTRFCSF
jgi:hypothetical protein